MSFWSIPNIRVSFRSFSWTSGYTTLRSWQHTILYNVSVIRHDDAPVYNSCVKPKAGWDSSVLHQELQCPAPSPVSTSPNPFKMNWNTRHARPPHSTSCLTSLMLLRLKVSTASLQNLTESLLRIEKETDPSFLERDVQQAHVGGMVRRPRSAKYQMQA